MSIKSLETKRLAYAFLQGITENIGGCMAEAIAVCLDSQKHQSTVLLSVTGRFNNDYSILFEPVTERMRRSYGDLEFTTETAAYGISILIIDANTELTVVERSRKGGGFDFWLGRKDAPGPYFERKARLEVSGIRCGTDGAINSRIKMKMDQTKRSDGSFPAYIIVVEFGAPKAKVIEK